MKRSHSAGQFQFTLDGSDDTAYIKSVDGGNVKSEVITEQVGPISTAYKSSATVGIEPISLEIGMGASRPMLSWIAESWSRAYSRRNGAIHHADFNGNAVLEQWFYRALIAETTIPKADATDNSPAYMSVKIQPEQIDVRPGSGPVQGRVGSRQMLWTPNSFRMSIDGLNSEGIISVDSFTVKQKHKQLYYGGERLPQIEPTGIDFPNISLTMSSAYAYDFIKWHHEVVVLGKKDTKAERKGELIFYDQSMQIPLMTVQFFGVGIYNLQFEKSEAAAEAIKKVKVELYVENMTIVSGFGLE